MRERERPLRAHQTPDKQERQNAGPHPALAVHRHKRHRYPERQKPGQQRLQKYRAVKYDALVITLGIGRILPLLHFLFVAAQGLERVGLEVGVGLEKLRRKAVEEAQQIV